MAYEIVEVMNCFKVHLGPSVADALLPRCLYIVGISYGRRLAHSAQTV